MSSLAQFTQPVFDFFQWICSIPHGSRHTRALSDAIAALARERGIPCYQDASGNLILRQPARHARPGAPTVIVQAHLDMVCQQTPDSTLDMARQGVVLQREGDWLRAQGTTLGGDDGIGVACCLALLSAQSLRHPPLELVLTVDEEIGMLGAAALDMKQLRGRLMLNLDAEEEGMLLCGCAGGATLTGRLPITRHNQRGTAIALTLSGLTGGHSGVEIDKGRANACLLLAQLLEPLLDSFSFSLCRFQGGGKDNAIPSHAQAQLLLTKGEPEAFVQALKELGAEAQRRFCQTDPQLCLSVERGPEQTDSSLTPQESRRALRCLCQVPNGVQRRNPHLPQLVQTSLNLGVAQLEEDQLTLRFCVRSSSDQDKRELLQRLSAFLESLGGQSQVEGDYPAWEFRPHSPLRQLATDLYQRQTGRPMQVKTIHAGLECGLFTSALPGLDCIAFGPTILDIHTPMERMSLSSVQRTWQLLTDILCSLSETD